LRIVTGLEFLRYTKDFKSQEDEEEDVRNYWVTLRTGEETLI